MAKTKVKKQTKATTGKTTGKLTDAPNLIQQRIFLNEHFIVFLEEDEVVAGR